MGKIVFLGTGYAVSNQSQENTHLAAVTAERTVLVDCPGNPVVRLLEAGIEFSSISDIVLTHFHPDHVSGFPLLVMDLWLLGRRQALNVYGPAHTIERARKMMDLFDWRNWPNFYPVEYHCLPEEERYLLIDAPDIRVLSSPSQHLIPAAAVRIEFPQTGRSVVYSSDSEPSLSVARLAEGANILIHEAAGESIGHSSARQAGEVAAWAGVEQLYLIHYNGLRAAESLIDEACQSFSGRVSLAKDLLEIGL